MKRFTKSILSLTVTATLIHCGDALRAESAAGNQTPANLVPERLPLVQRATHLIGLAIHDRRNHEIGRIDDLVINLGSGQVLGAMAAPAHIYGDFHVFIPAGSFASAGGDQAILGGERTNLTAEPCVTREAADSPDFSKKIAETYTRFGATPIWKEQDCPRGFTRFSRLSGFKIRNRAHESLGQAADLMVDLAAARIVFLVASLDGAGHNYYAAPPSALSLDPDDSALLLAVDKAALARVAQNGDFIWAQMDNPNWVAATCHLYGQDPGFALTAPAPVSTAASENLFPKIEGSSTTIRIVKPATFSDAELARNIMAAIVHEGLEAPFAKNQVQVTTARAGLPCAARPPARTRRPGCAPSPKKWLVPPTWMTKSKSRNSRPRPAGGTSRAL